MRGNVRLFKSFPTGKNTLFPLALCTVILFCPANSQYSSASASPPAGIVSGQIVDDAAAVDPRTNLASVALEDQVAEARETEVARGGFISGRVYEQGTKKGVAGVRVLAEHGKHGGKTVVLSKPSGQAGYYIIRGLDEGTYVVRVAECPGYAQPRGYEREEVTLRPGEQAEGIDFVLRRSPRVLGRVVDSKGNPIADAEVIAWPNRTHQDDPLKLTTRTAADGYFEIVGLDPENTFTPAAVKPGWIHKPLPGLDPLSAAAEGLFITMYSQCSISGRVVDTSGQPLSDASVKMTRRGRSATASLVPAKTSSSGYFMKEGLLGGKYNIGVSPKGQPGFHILTLELDHGEHLSDLTLIYDPDAGLKISGRVTDTRGRPVVNARIHAGGPTFANTHTDEDGRYVLKGLEEGRYSLTVDHNGHRYLEGHWASAGATDVDLVLEPRQTSQIAARVVSADTGRPVTSFSYVVQRGVYDDVDPKAANHRDILGTVYHSGFRQVDHPEGRLVAKTYDIGDHTMLVRAEGYAPSALVVSAPAENIVVSMTRGASVDAGAVIIDGPPRGYSAPDPDEAYVLGRSKPDGTFQIDDLSPSPKLLSAWHKDYGTDSVTVTPGVKVPANLTLRLHPLGLLEGTVSFNGQIVNDREQAEIRVKYQGGELGYLGLLPVGTDGTYQLKRLRAGITDVTVGLDPYRRGTHPRWSMTRTVVIETARTTRLNYDFPTGNAVLTGTVSINGRGLGRAHIHIVYLVDDARLTQPSYTDSDGRYRLYGLPEGSAKIDVFATSPSGERVEQTFDLAISRGAIIHRDIEL